MTELHRKIQSSFAKQGLMQTLGASLDKIENGLVHISCAFNSGLSQQNNFFHAGVITSIADSACGYAAMTLAPLEKDILTVEFKINFVNAANTSKIIAIGKVIRPGKTITVCEGSVYDESGQKLIASMIATMMTV